MKASTNTKLTTANSNPYEIKLTIIPSQHPLGYTPLEQIHGSLHLTVRSRIRLQCIEVGLHGDSTSFLNVRREERQSSKDLVTLYEEKHKIVDISKIVFPESRNITADLIKTGQIGNVTTSDSSLNVAPDYILGPGSYVFPFELLIPLESYCYTLNLQTRQQTTTEIISKDQKKTSYSSLLSQLSISSNNSAVTESSLYQDKDTFNHLPNCPLPPSLNGPNDYYYVQYLFTATIHKSSSRDNITVSQPLKLVPFTPLYDRNRDANGEISKEMFIQKQGIFLNKIPEIIAVKYDRNQSDHNMIVPARDVPFGFELRWKNEGILTLGQKLNFKIFIVSQINPRKYLNPDNRSSKLGLIILKRLSINLISTTQVSCHNKTHVESKFISILDIHTQGDIDLAYAQISKQHSLMLDPSIKKPKHTYEIQLPKSLYQDHKIPVNLAPSFESCHLKRTYSLQFKAVFEDPLAQDAGNFKGQYQRIELMSPLTLASGIEVPRVEYMRESQRTNQTNQSQSVNELSSGVVRSPSRRLPSYDEAMVQGLRR